MSSTKNGDNLNRLAKMFMDTGEAQSTEDAERILQGYRLAIQFGPKVAKSPTLQAALLTAVNAGRRCFLGGVEVAGPVEVPLQVPWPRRATLAEAIRELKGKSVEKVDPNIPLILIGDTPILDQPPLFCIKATFEGWCGGVMPDCESAGLAETQEFTPAGVLAGALAISEAFQYLQRGNAYAGRRALGLSLWEPEKGGIWQEVDRGPRVSVLPSSAWIIGLGHLGQAYLWTLGFLPYAYPNEVELVLQDYDDLTEANDSTSLLTNLQMVGRKKTRAMAEWSEAMGFRARILERKFSNDFHVAADEPHVALCGVDNVLARGNLEEVGFQRVIEAGLGAGAGDFLCFQSHSFPASHSAHKRWASVPSTNADETLLNLPAYRKLATKGLDRCGLTQLAGHSVGASFVGAVTSAFVIAQLLKVALGNNMYETLDGDLCTGKVESIPNQLEIPPFNPGLTSVLL